MNKGSDTPKVEHASARVQSRLLTPPYLQSSLPDGRPWMAFHRCERGYLVRFCELADFEVSSTGNEVTIHPVPGVSAQTVDHLYQNQALPLALSLQLRVVLHGSAVEIGETSAAFLAGSRSGKSTLAASFSSNGFRFLTDDGLLIDKIGEEYFIRPSHPSIRLWEDSREALARSSYVEAPAIDYSSKVKVLAGEPFRFCAESRRLGHVYFLGDGSSERVSITAITSQKSFIEMLRHSFLFGVDERERLKHNFQQLTELSRLPIFFRLDYPRRYDILDRVREAVTKHIELGFIPSECVS